MAAKLETQDSVSDFDFSEEEESERGQKGAPSEGGL